MRYITADWVYPVSSPPITEGVVVMDGDRVVDVTHRSEVGAEKLDYFNGMLIPGFINTHCHLELSHLKGQVATGIGLLSFLERVVRLRGNSEEEIQQAIQEADAYMWREGIQAVGDISNKTDTFITKSRSRIRYYNFVEMFDLMQPHLTGELISGNLGVFHQAPEPKAAVPHAPYTVSESLFGKINALNTGEVTVCIHNQETPAEEELFRNGTGAFHDFYRQFGFNLDHFKPTGKSSMQYAMAQMDPE
ncbi:MAG TPA: amidohydrolase family protein, partial [Saprospiraceae bacterium]|nr:amidohydrolase family protein [Saprospiraceae bacterium]